MAHTMRTLAAVGIVWWTCAGVAEAALCDPSATYPNTWGGWSDWSDCSATNCGDSGFQTRTGTWM